MVLYTYYRKRVLRNGPQSPQMERAYRTTVIAMSLAPGKRIRRVGESTKVDRNGKNYIFLRQNLRDWTVKYTSLRISDKRRDSGSTAGCAWDCSCVFSFGVISDRIRLYARLHCSGKVSNILM